MFFDVNVDLIVVVSAITSEKVIDSILLISSH